MTQKDKIGLGVLIALFAVFFGILVFSWKDSGEPRKLEDNVLIQQRMINLQKSK